MPNSVLKTLEKVLWHLSCHLFSYPRKAEAALRWKHCIQLKGVIRRESLHTHHRHLSGTVHKGTNHGYGELCVSGERAQGEQSTLGCSGPLSIVKCTTEEGLQKGHWVAYERGGKEEKLAKEREGERQREKEEREFSYS